MASETVLSDNIQKLAAGEIRQVRTAAHLHGAWLVACMAWPPPPPPPLRHPMPGALTARPSLPCSLEAFQAATSVSARQDAVRQATLPGAPLPSSTTAAEKKSVRAVALGVGLGIGLGVPALAGAAAAAYWVWWKPAHTASRLTRPML